MADGSIVIKMQADVKNAAQALQQTAKALQQIRAAAMTTADAITDLESDIDALNNKKIEQQGEIEKLLNTMNNAGANLDFLIESKAKMEELEQKAADADYRVTALYSKLSEEIGKHPDLINENGSWGGGDSVQEVNELVRQLAEAQIESRNLNAELDAMQDKFQGNSSDLAERIAQESARMDELNGQYEEATERLSEYDTQLAGAAEKKRQLVEDSEQLAEQERITAEEAERLATQVNLAGVATKLAGLLTQKHLTIIEKIVKRIGSYFRRVFVFSVITSALRKIRSGLFAILKQNEELQSGLSTLQGSLLTAFYPIWAFIEPKLVSLVQTLNYVAQITAEIIAHLFGTTREAAMAGAEAMYNQVKATEDAENAAKKANKEAKRALASFDQINRLTFNESDSDATADNSNALNFEIDENLPGWLDSVTGFIDRAREAVGELWTKLDEAGVIDEVREKIDKLKKKLSDLTIDFFLTAKDIFFPDPEQLNPETVIERVITAIGGLLGAVIGFSIGGPMGAIKGTLTGVVLATLFNSILFDNDGKLSWEELCQLIQPAIMGLAGALLGWGLFPGAALPAGALGFTIGAVLGLVISKLTFDGNGTVDPDEAMGLLLEIVFAIAGGLLFANAAAAGAAATMGALGVGVGAVLGLVFYKIIFNGDGEVSKKEFIETVGTILGGIGLAIALSGLGIAGGLLGLTLGAALGLGISSLFILGDPDADKSVVDWFTELGDKIKSKWNSVFGTVADEQEDQLNEWDKRQDEQASLLDKIRSNYIETQLNNAERMRQDTENTVTAITGFWDKAGQAQQDTINAMAQSQETQGQAIADWWAETSEKAAERREKLKEGFDNFTDDMGKRAEAFKNDWADIFTKVGNHISEKVSTGTEKASTAFSEFKTNIGEKLGDFKNNWQEIFTDIGKHASDKISGGLDKIQKGWATFSADIGDRLEKFKKGWADIFDNLRKTAVEAFEKIKTGFSNIWTGLESVIKGAINRQFENIEGWINGIIDALNIFLSGLNWVSEKLNDLTGSTPVLDLNIGHVSIPRLAQGAVIPANKEFLAVLGDQSNGTNIEAPLATIEQAVRNVLNENGASGSMTIVVQLGNERIAERVINDMRNLSRGRGTSVIRV